jgi:hypothetical protein
MRGAFLAAILALFTLTTLFATEARAQSTDPAGAEALFQKGREAMDASDFDVACEMFQESFDLDPAVGTVMNLAVCEEKRGHLARSWERWRQALGMLDESDDRMGYAAIQMEAVEGRLAHLTIVAQDGAFNNLTVRRDDVLLGEGGLGEELPVDPGTHVIVVESPGHEARRYTLTLEAGERRKMAVAPGPQEEREGFFSRPSSRKTMGAVAFGVGAVGLGTAVTTGILLPGQHEKVLEGCPNKSCTSDGSQALTRAKTLVALNTAGWIVAGVGAAAGITLLLTLPKETPHPADSSRHETTVGVSLLGNGIQVFGDF